MKKKSIRKAQCSAYLKNLALKMCGKNSLLLEKWKKQVPILNSCRIFKNHYFFMKINRNDIEHFINVYIKFCMKIFKYEFLTNILLGLGFYLYTLIYIYIYDKAKL